jgi:Glycosyl transferase family 8
MESTDVKSKETIRVFIGSSPSEWLPAKVLEHSIRSRTDQLVDVERLFEANINIPKSKRKDCSPRTPFSFQRFIIPELCSHQGRAIYLDADMLVFGDINELWSIPMDENQLLYVNSMDENRGSQFSVMLLDAEKLDWDIRKIVQSMDQGTFTYDQLMYEFIIAPKRAPNIGNVWNALEHYSDNTRLLHYTDMAMQPWVSLINPLRDMWVRELVNAISAQFISIEDLKHQISLKHVRPSLLCEVNGILSGEYQVKNIILTKLDKNFNPPYKQYIPGIWQRIKRKLPVNL